MRSRRDIVLAAGIIALVVLLALLSATAHAAPRAGAIVAWRPRAWTPPSAAARGNAGLWIAIDPVDGVRGMPAAEGLAQHAAFTGDNAPVRLTMRADGSGRAQLDDRWANFAVVTLGANGKPVWSCVYGRKAAAQFMQQPSVPCVAPATEAAPEAER